VQRKVAKRDAQTSGKSRLQGCSNLSSKSRKMKVGLDIDETITEVPWFFKSLTEGLKKDGHEIFILTFRHKEMKEETEGMLAEMGIVYDKVFYGEGIIDYDFKAKIAEKHGINLMIDDNREVLRAMPLTVSCLEMFGKMRRIRGGTV